MCDNAAQLAALLRAQVKGILQRNSHPSALLFSGGLDSAVLAKLCLETAPDTILYTVGISGCKDIENAKSGARALGVEVKIIELDPEELEEAIRDVSEITGSRHPVVITFQLPLYFAAGAIAEPTLISGQGADELFGGYERYTRMDTDTLKNSLKEDTNRLLDEGILYDQSIARHFKKTLKTPYLAPEIVEFARSLPVSEMVAGNGRKLVLRAAAEKLGLPSKICQREKRAAQYGTGIVKTLRKRAKARGMNLSQLIECAAKRDNF